MEDEIIFSGKYKEFEFSEHFMLGNAGKEEVAAILARISEQIDSPAYTFSGIDCSKIDLFVDKLSKGSEVFSLAQILSSLKPAEVRENLLSACDATEAIREGRLIIPSSKYKGSDSVSFSKDLLPIAESYFIHSLLKKMNIPFKLSEKMFPSIPTPKQEPTSERIAFIGKYKEWVAVKKFKIETNSKEYEISAILSSINFTIINKAFNFVGVGDEAKVQELIKGKRKGFVALGEALKGISETDPKKSAYLVCKVCEELGYRPYSSPHMLGNAYPDIKPPKMKGRKPKG